MKSLNAKTTLPERLVKFPVTWIRSKMLISKTSSVDNWFAPNHFCYFDKTAIVEVLITFCLVF